MSHFWSLIKKLRSESGLTLEAVAKKIGSHKGYVSGIENDKVNPPSVKIILKYAKLFGQIRLELLSGEYPTSEERRRARLADFMPRVVYREQPRLNALKGGIHSLPTISPDLFQTF